MISHLTGRLLHLDLKYVILDVAGVGYKVAITTPTLEALTHAVNKESVGLFTYLAVRDDSLDLYGFLSKDDLEFFELLLTISGIGPKSALAILNVASADTLKEAIYNEDPSYLTKVSGISKKNAEKIVRELKDKAPAAKSESDRPNKFSSESSMAIEALLSLGFDADSARQALKKINKDLPTKDQVRLALKHLQ